MVSLARTIRSIRRVGLREWWRQMQYIGDAKSGRYVGKDQYVVWILERRVDQVNSNSCRFGNRYFENMNAEEEIPGVYAAPLRGKGYLNCESRSSALG